MGYVHILIITNDDIFWDRLYVFIDQVRSVTSHINQHQNPVNGDFCRDSDFEIVNSFQLLSADGDQLTTGKRYKYPISLNGLELSYFVYLLRFSQTYRRCVIRFWHSRAPKIIPVHRSIKIVVSLKDPPQQIIDYAWNLRVTYMVSERSELDTAMSWLSTLGGAYSALGDHFTHCAQMAGRISLQQFKIALRLGDENTVARCKLFIALSMIQMNRFRQARRLIEEQYHTACSSSCQDIRLIRMCRGIWCKMRYERSKYITRKRLSQPK